MSYFQDIQTGIRTTLKGLSLTFRHLRNATRRRTPQGIASANYFDVQNGLVTLQYPHEQLPIPDNGRYRLRNEIEDCIVCDKCAKVCPVDCITIDAIKATEEVGRASDGSPIRLYAAKFDIDMAKCCYCGLCTVVCPTECLTMDKKFDYSEFELGKLTYNFSNLSPEQADEKRTLYEQFLLEKEAARAAQLAAKSAAQPSSDPVAKPVFRPTAKPVAKTPPAEPANSEGSSIEHPLTDATPEEMQHIAQGGLEMKKHPVFQPAEKPATPPTDIPTEGQSTKPAQASEPVEAVKPTAKPAGFRPTMKPGSPKPAVDESGKRTSTDAGSESPEPDARPPGFRPTMKPALKETNERSEADAPKAKPAGFKPTMKPSATKAEESGPELPNPAESPVPKPAGFRPTMKPVKPAETEPIAQPEAEVPEPPKPKPAFRPTMKPKVAPSEPESLVPTVENTEENTDDLPVELPKPKPAFRPTMKPKPKSDDGTSASS
ncbi:4Fe-4S dicluster domain-containing protein [Spirosoma koreense]